MSNYTPTAEEVRMYYEIGRDEADGEIDRDATAAEFDRWLAQHDAEVALGAVQRVIRKIDKSPAVTWTGKGGARHIAVAIENIYRVKEEA